MGQTEVWIRAWSGTKVRSPSEADEGMSSDGISLVKLVADPSLS